MNKQYRIALFISLALILSALLFVWLFIYREQIAVLNPKGVIALKERNLMIIATLLMLIVVIPAIVMTVLFAWKYRASNPEATYTPNWDYSLLAESIWWGVPCAIIVALSIITWKASHELDPFRPLAMDKKPLTIQVVALQWKWLFIYPEQNIASVNFFQIPTHTPINFEITADAPMNSFWLPQIAGQIYAMPGMRTKLHLVADEEGQYRGSSANLSGRGFAGMTFIAQASTEADFDKWVESVAQSTKSLDVKEYEQLAEPSENNPVVTFQVEGKGLFDQIIMKYMMPS
jgi:cytochrome o ubiquinol oxidase subunit 2